MISKLYEVAAAAGDTLPAQDSLMVQIHCWETTAAAWATATACASAGHSVQR